MRILISNDDGYFAPGLLALAEELKKISEVVVVAPERDRSGASNSLTLDRPLVVKHPPGDVISVNGTPTDCVHLAVTGLLEHRPDMVVSGINHGTNMGDDTIYSGTVAAAMEGFLLGIPSIAVSLAGKQGANFAAAAQVAREIVERHQRQAFDGNMLLNVNVPDIPYSKLRGLQVTRLGRRHKAEGIVETVNPRGQTVYWIGPAGSAQDAGEGTDFYAVEHNMVSVTPLQIDLTRYSDVDKTSDWLSADSAVNQLATISKA